VLCCIGGSGAGCVAFGAGAGGDADIIIIILVFDFIFKVNCCVLKTREILAIKSWQVDT